MHLTRDVPDGLSGDLGGRIVAHYAGALDASRGKLDNSTRGSLFEATVYDGLVYYGVAEERIGSKLDASWLGQRTLNAELDIVVSPRGVAFDKSDPSTWAFGLLLKTSLRERWKQIDRDTHVASTFARFRYFWGLTYLEQNVHTAEKQIELLAKKNAQLHTRGVELVTVTDFPMMDKILGELL